MIGVELVKDRSTKKPATDELSWILSNSFKRGLLIIGAGRSVIRIAPPLNITLEEAEKGLEILEGLIREANEKLK